MMRYRIAGVELFLAEKLMQHRPARSNAVGCGSRTDAITNFLLRTLQQ